MNNDDAKKLIIRHHGGKFWLYQPSGCALVDADHPRELRRYVLERWPDATLTHDYDCRHLDAPEEK